MEYSLSVILHILHVTYVEGTSNAEHSAKSFGSGERVSTKFHLCCSSAFTRQVCFLCFEISVLCRQHYSYSIAYLVKFSMTVKVYCMTVIF